MVSNSFSYFAHRTHTINCILVLWEKEIAPVSLTGLIMEETNCRSCSVNAALILTLLNLSNKRALGLSELKRMMNLMLR